MEAVREFEEHAMTSGHQSLVKEAAKYASSETQGQIVGAREC